MGWSNVEEFRWRLDKQEGCEYGGAERGAVREGAACRGCYEVHCMEQLHYYIPGTSIILTATNFCAPNYGLTVDVGGHCNPPNHHFVMSIAAFKKIAIWKAGVMPI